MVQLNATDFKAMGYKYACAEVILSTKSVNICYFKRERHMYMYKDSLSDFSLRLITLMSIEDAIKNGY